MSAKTDLRAALVADSALTALVGTNITANRVEQDAPRPFVVYSQTATEPYRGLDGTLHGRKTVFELQCWADTRAAADAVADAVEAVLDAQHQSATARADGYDGDLDLEATVLSVDWWE